MKLKKLLEPLQTPFVLYFKDIPKATMFFEEKPESFKNSIF